MMRFMNFAVILVALVVSFTTAAPLNAPGPEQQEFHWQGKVAAGRSVEIKGVNGSIRAEATSGNLVEVTAVKRGRRSDPSSVKIEVIEHDGGVTLCAVYPSDDPSRPNECKPGKGGRMNVRDNDVQVNFTVRVPSGIHFVGRTVNGDVDVTSLAGNVDASTVNGGIDISTSGYAQAGTVNGSITASMGSADWAGRIEFETVNGSITVELPAGTNTEVEAETVNGDISTDFPLTVRGRFNSRHISGVIGTGGRELEFETVNGSITIRRAS